MGCAVGGVSNSKGGLGGGVAGSAAELKFPASALSAPPREPFYTVAWKRSFRVSKTLLLLA